MYCRDSIKCRFVFEAGFSENVAGLSSSWAGHLLGFKHDEVFLFLPGTIKEIQFSITGYRNRCFR